jgi:putative acetyltransferase
MHIRPYHASDKRSAFQLYYECVHAVDASYYTLAQLDAWAPKEISYYSWLDELPTIHSFVVEIDELFAGFAAMRPDGEVHIVFVHKHHQRKGIATALMNEILTIARKLSLTRLYLESSSNAKKFYENYGFITEGENLKEYNGEYFLLTAMSMTL